MKLKIEQDELLSVPFINSRVSINKDRMFFAYKHLNTSGRRTTFNGLEYTRKKYCPEINFMIEDLFCKK